MNKKIILLIRLLAAIVTIGCIYVFAPWKAAIYYFYPLPATVQEQVDDAVNEGLDGIIVYVQQGEKQPEFYASGWHNRAEEIPADPNALFKIASIGKLYRASAIAKLVANGTLSLDGTLAEYLPSMQGRIENADDITLRMLVQHRSGIPNYTDQDGFSWSEHGIGVNANLALIVDLPADFEPGSDYGYSNTNYLLLGMIMDRVLGYANEEFIKQEILAPLALSHTFLSIKDINLDELMSGYYVGYDSDFKALDQGFIATAEDVGVFIRALNDGSLFTDKEQQIYSAIYEYEHTGWVIGYYSIARYHKDIDAVVIQFVNTVGENTLLFSNTVYSRIIKIIENR
ncbi:serine hydrolase domain-containing protein [Thalassotalea profundi]|uniref:Serine-type D-Ala-D-Ala carboxypeptidase n=1 Tax=Thalassotalea profundi TaxID=2036687 RepID=A0ABQ3IEA6_9GAMM|nr:serine hydrolase domain-containing protein [Thalassotalea profundi]GHE81339.1 serine-type D-Ala-D-Ala carboxypeptidase [Thalassotalea profundi]